MKLPFSQLDNYIWASENGGLYMDGIYKKLMQYFW